MGSPKKPGGNGPTSCRGDLTTPSKARGYLSQTHFSATLRYPLEAAARNGRLSLPKTPYVLIFLTILAPGRQRYRHENCTHASA